ncbi:hypothetical protein FQN57_001614 [Myotisia sp. PD_48]|nr:hypothetical protein FQN57_001614 [Myotisia sp. PD_48]
MLKSTYKPHPGLPEGWTAHKAPTGQTYYYNAETKQSTYKTPINGPVLNPTPTPIPAPFSVPFNFAQGYDPKFQGSGTHDRRRSGRQPEDRPKSKHPIPGCEPWLLVKTKLGRRFVYNPDAGESFWKFPPDIMKGVVEYDIREREAREKKELVEEKPQVIIQTEPSPIQASESRNEAGMEIRQGSSDEYEEVEVTDDEEERPEDESAKRLKSELDEDKPVEFNEDDIAYQLAAAGEYGLDPEEYDEEGWDEGDDEFTLTAEDSAALFRDLLDDFRINPYTPWDTVIEEGRIIDDTRYTALPNMKSRREVWSKWSIDRIKDHQERKKLQEREDPRVRYLAVLQEYASPKLYWAEFKRKYRKEPEMKDSKLSDKDREKYYREHITRLKLPESTRKSDLSALLKSIPASKLNLSTTLETLPLEILTDLRFIALPAKVRDELVEGYILTLAPAPDMPNVSTEEKENQTRLKQERVKREKALAARELMVNEGKRRQQSTLHQSKEMLRQDREEVSRAMGLRAPK